MARQLRVEYGGAIYHVMGRAHGKEPICLVKVKQKISGCFRTLEGAQCFARMRGYLSTCRKQGINLWDACFQAAIGNPFMPTLPESDQTT